MIEENIKEWIERISEPNKNLNGVSICPFAKTSNYSIKPYTDSKPELDDKDLIIFVLPDRITEDDVESKCKDLNQRYKDLIFLPDHKDADNNINGIATGNGVYNLILCQRRSDLIQARSKLGISGYYDLWSREYYKKIMDY